MSFPVMLAGVRTVAKDDWCKGCHKGPVSTVMSTGKKKKPFCMECWQPFLQYLSAAERGETALTGNAGERTSIEGDASVGDTPILAAYVCCKNKSCAADWKKAKHTESGYCSWTCAVQNGWVAAPTLPPYVCCKNKSCAADWKKAKHNASGYCSWTCAVQNGWEELSVNIPPPVESQPVAPVESQPVAPVESQPDAPVESQPVAPVESQPVAPVESQPANFYSIMDKRIGKGFLDAYAQKFKNLKPVEASCNVKRKGIGFDDNTAKRRRFFHCAACKIEFVIGGDLD